MVDMHDYLERVYAGAALDRSDTRAIFADILNNRVEPELLASFLIAMKMKGESPAEIAGAAEAMMLEATPLPRPDYAFADIVGTGGDGYNTINVSSAAAVVAASCGAAVAKHGNGSFSSLTGSADLFNACGVNLAMSPRRARACLDETGFTFLFAPQYHSAVRHAMAVRRALKTRTLFNLLGPLCNPGRPTHTILGVYKAELVRPFADTLQLLGYQRAMVVHGSGMDELALHGPSMVAEINGDKIQEYQLTPADFGLNTFAIDAIEGGLPEQNKRLALAALSGTGAPAHLQAIAMNAAALLVLMGLEPDHKTAAEAALQSMQQGRPMALLERVARLSQTREVSP